jgi:hypothetical protein
MPLFVFSNQGLEGDKWTIHIVISLAKVPHPNLVEVMQTQAPSYRVEQARICHGDGNNLGDIEFEEIRVSKDGFVVRIADESENEKGYRNKVQKRCCYHGIAASFGGSHGRTLIVGP